MSVYTAALAVAVEATLAALATRQTAVYAVLRPDQPVPTYSADAGSKYVRIVETFADGRKRAFAFINSVGDVFKASSWYAPTKDVRGSIFTDTAGVENFGIDGPMTVVAAATFYKAPEKAVEAVVEADETASGDAETETGDALMDGDSPLAGDENVLMNENVITA